MTETCRVCQSDVWVLSKRHFGLIKVTFRSCQMTFWSGKRRLSMNTPTRVRDGLSHGWVTVQALVRETVCVYADKSE